MYCVWGGIVKVDGLGLRGCFLPFLHVYIWFYWKVIILFIFIVRFQYLENGVNWELITKDDINDLGCTKLHVLPNIYIFRLAIMDKFCSLEHKLLNIIWAQFISFLSSARVTITMSFLLTYMLQLPLLSNLNQNGKSNDIFPL